MYPIPNSPAARLGFRPLALLMLFFLLCALGYSLLLALMNLVWENLGHPPLQQALAQDPVSREAKLLLKLNLGLSIAFLFGLPAWLAARLLGRPALQLGLVRPRPLAVLLLAAFLLPLAALPLVQAAFIPPEIFQLPKGLEALESFARQQEANVEQNILLILPDDFALNLVVLGVIPAVCEELFFRGGLQPVLQRKLGRWVGLVVVALLFSLIHVQAYGFFSRALLGLLLGYLYLQTGSIWLSITAHFANNLFSLVTGTWMVRQGLTQELGSSRMLTEWPWVLGSLLITGGLLWTVHRLAEPVQNPLFRLADSRTNHEPAQGDETDGSEHTEPSEHHVPKNPANPDS